MLSYEYITCLLLVHICRVNRKNKKSNAGNKLVFKGRIRGEFTLRFTLFLCALMVQLNGRS